ncbi:retrovirus-related pol polyprotein from transposon TNT 1-94, partial [Tanacetum coccineum]
DYVPLLPAMLAGAAEDQGEGSAIPAEPQHTPINPVSSTSQPTIPSKDPYFCDACKIRKQAHASHKAKNMVSTKRCLELLHMDLFGPLAIKSYGGNLYTLVVVDDYYMYTSTRFLKTKNDAFKKFEILNRKIQNQLGSSIIAIRTDHGQEFNNEVQFRAYCDAQGITHNFSAPRTP